MRFGRTAMWLAVALLAACNSAPTDQGGEEPIGNPTGAYDLATVNDQPLPFLLDQMDEDKLEVVFGRVSLFADRTFSDSTLFRLTLGGVESFEADVGRGTWSLGGNTVTFTLGDGSGSYTMLWDGDRSLVQSFENLVLVYRR